MFFLHAILLHTTLTTLLHSLTLTTHTHTYMNVFPVAQSCSKTNVSCLWHPGVSREQP